MAIIPFPLRSPSFSSIEVAAIHHWAAAQVCPRRCVEIDTGASEGGGDVMMVAFGDVSAPVEFFLVRQGARWVVETVEGTTLSFSTIGEALASIEHKEVVMALAASSHPKRLAPERRVRGRQRPNQEGSGAPATATDPISVFSKTRS